MSRDCLLQILFRNDILPGPLNNPSIAILSFVKKNRYSIINMHHPESTIPTMYLPSVSTTLVNCLHLHLKSQKNISVHVSVRCYPVVTKQNVRKKTILLKYFSHLQSVSLTPVMHLELRIYSRIFEINDANEIPGNQGTGRCPNVHTSQLMP